MRSLASLLSFSLLAAAAIVRPLNAAEPFEQPPQWRAAEVLSPELVSGPNHRVEDPVRNDGVMNLYSISSQFGALSAQSTAELVKRVHEYNAIAALKEMEGSKEFGDAVKEAGSDVVDGAAALATHPVDTVSGAVSGVGALFRRAGNTLTGAPRSEYEDNVLMAVTGVSSKKREFAAELGVDVYSSNVLLQEALDRVARVAAAGNLTASAGLAAVGGAWGTAVSVTGGTENLNEILREKPPTELRIMNEEALARMGVSEGVADLFISNTVFSPSYQTMLVDALNRMPGVADREAFVKTAVRTETDDLAMFRQRQARMYASYHAEVGKLRQMFVLGDLAAAQTVDGKLVLLLPLDYVVWTQGVAGTADALIAAAAKISPGAAHEVRFGGAASPVTRRALEAAGWTVHENQADGLIGPG